MEESSFYGAFGSGGSSGGGGGSTEATIVYINGKKDSAGTIAKGLPVYLVGYDSDIHTVELANANSGSTMPVIGFTNEPFNNTDSKKIITFGKLEGVDTTSTVSTLNPNGETWAVNDALYMNSTAGGLTKVRPTGTNFIQRIAKVLRVDASGGQIFIFNTARTAGLPNLSQDNVWVGDANGYPQMVNKSTLGGNTIYTANDTIGSGRIATLTDTLSFKGSDTLVSSSNLKILDSASSTLWDFRNNGDVYIGQNTVFEGGAFGFVFNRTTGLNTFELQTNGANFATFRSASTNIYSSIINLGSLGGTDGLKIESDRVRYYTSVGSAGVIHDIHADRFALFGQGFSTPANSYFSIGSFTRIGTENVSLQGETFIKGNDTLSTSTALAIYDGDVTPNKLWDFRNNGDIYIGTGISPIIEVDQSITFNFPATSAGQFIIDGTSQSASDSILFEVKSVGTGNSFNIDQKGEIESTGITGTDILNIRNASDTLGLNIKSGVSLFHVTQMLTRGAEAYSNGIRQVFSSTTEEMKWQQANASDFNHQIKSGTVAGSNEVRFFNKGWSNSDGFIIGASAIIGTEDISLQGETVIKGDDTLSTSTALAIYDGDTTPSKLWDFVNSGDVNLGQAVDINTSNTFNFVNGSREVGIASWNTHAYWGLNNGTRRWDLISANSSTVFNANEFGIANGSSVPVRIFNNTSVALGNVNKGSLNNSYSVQTNGDTLIGGNLDATDGTNIIELDFNNYPKVKLGTPTQEWWLIEGDGTGSVFNNGDLYIYDSTGATKLVQFKQSGGGILLGGTLDMDNNRITNAVINPSVQETTSTATFTINADQETDGVLTAMATNTIIASPTGTPVQSQSLIFRFKDDGTSRTLTWNAIFRAIGVTLPTATTANKLLYVGCKYNSTDTKWDVVSVQEEA